jgi:polar amino acid transport system substrate-binding protein
MDLKEEREQMERKKLFLRVVAAAAAAATALALGGCAGDSGSSADETLFEKAQRTGKITIGFANAQPYAYLDDDGELVGEAVMIGKEVLEQYGITEVEGVLTEFDALLPGLVAGRYDMVMAGQFINTTRAEQVDFMNPEYQTGPAMAVRKGNPLDLHSYQDVIDNPAAVIAAVGGSSELKYLQDLGVPEGQISVVPDFTSGFAALVAGRVDAATMQDVTLTRLFEDQPDADAERVDDFETPVIDGKKVTGWAASYVKKGENDDLIEAFNAGLEQLKESGRLLEILQEYGFGPEAFPGDMTAAEVLAEQSK